jgi:hypothetical protein
MLKKYGWLMEVVHSFCRKKWIFCL